MPLNENKETLWGTTSINFPISCQHSTNELMKPHRERPVLTSQFDASKLQKQPSSVIQVHLDQSANFGPLSLIVCVTVTSSTNR